MSGAEATTAREEQGARTGPIDPRISAGEQNGRTESGHQDATVGTMNGGAAGSAVHQETPAARTLCGEAAECASDVALAQPLERAVAQLTDTLARHAEHRADLLEGVLAPTLQPEVQ